MFAISNDGQERKAPGVVRHKHAGHAHQLQLGGGSGGLHDGQEPGREADQQRGGGGHLHEPHQCEVEAGQQF